MTEEVNVLDQGYVKIIESWGSDERIIEAARMSTQKGFEGWGPFRCVECDGVGRKKLAWTDKMLGDCPACKNKGSKPGDEKLLRYLWEHKHHTPFEMAGAIFEVQAPIFVFREWHRHRTQSYNEMSARYSPLPDLNYVPDVNRLMAGIWKFCDCGASATWHATENPGPCEKHGNHIYKDDPNKQAGTIKGSRILTEENATKWSHRIRVAYEEAQDDYTAMLADGVPKELARLVLPVGRYSCMRASANLRNWCAFLTLRMDVNAQFEIREYAKAVHDLLQARFPRTLALFDEGRAA